MKKTTVRKNKQLFGKVDRKINLPFELEIPKLGKELLNNLANGIVIYGFLEAFR